MYADTDTIMNELDEFYPYIEMSHVAQNSSRFEGSFDGGEKISYGSLKIGYS